MLTTFLKLTGHELHISAKQIGRTDNKWQKVYYKQQIILLQLQAFVESIDYIPLPIEEKHLQLPSKGG